MWYIVTFCVLALSSENIDCRSRKVFDNKQEAEIFIKKISKKKSFDNIKIDSLIKKNNKY